MPIYLNGARRPTPLKVQRQRKDWAVKLARCVVASNDVVVYEDLKIQNMVKNHHLPPVGDTPLSKGGRGVVMLRGINSLNG